MQQEKVYLYCQLKREQQRIEEALAKLRNEIIEAYPEDTEIRLQDGSLKIIYQEKKVYDDPLVFSALPDPELWKVICKTDASKIAALVKAKVMDEDWLEGTYRTTRTAYLYVHP
jgi:hypothetical protein